jgi:hypothetical protein
MNHIGRERKKRVKEVEMKYQTARHDDAEFVVAWTAIMRVRVPARILRMAK